MQAAGPQAPPRRPPRHEEVGADDTFQRQPVDNGARKDSNKAPQKA